MLRLKRLISQSFTALFLFATTAFAGSEGVEIQPEEWRAMTEGKTVYYSIAGMFYGREYYLPGTDKVFFQHNDGTCLRGTWSFEAPWYSFTFTYDGYSLPPHRFLHRRQADLITVISDDPDLPSQQVDRIIVAPFTCDVEATS